MRTKVLELQFVLQKNGLFLPVNAYKLILSANIVCLPTYKLKIQTGKYVFYVKYELTPNNY